VVALGVTPQGLATAVKYQLMLILCVLQQPSHARALSHARRRSAHDLPDFDAPLARGHSRSDACLRPSHDRFRMGAFKGIKMPKRWTTER